MQQINTHNDIAMQLLNERENLEITNRYQQAVLNTLRKIAAPSMRDVEFEYMRMLMGSC